LHTGVTNDLDADEKAEVSDFKREKRCVKTAR
jgi:hypothetical protein